MAAKKAKPKSRKPGTKGIAAKCPAAKASPTKKGGTQSAARSVKAKNAAPKSASGPAKQKALPTKLAVTRAEAPERKAMLEQALAGTPQEGQRVAEKAAGWAAAHARSLADPRGFWGEAAAGIDWIRRWDEILDESNPPFYRWFKGGVLNTCYN